MKTVHALLITALGAAPFMAAAQASDWSVAIGPGVLAVPEHPGADDVEVLPVPAVDISYGERLFLNTRHGLGAYLVSGTNRQVGASISFRRGRDSDDGELLRGLEDIDGSPVAQLFAHHDVGRLRFTARFAQSLGEETGLTLDTTAAWRIELTAATRMALGVQSTFGNGEYMRTWFGITPEQAASSGLASYDIGSGLQSAGAFAAVTHQISRAWTLAASASWERLLGDAADSPIVEREDLPVAMLAASYRFGQ